MQGCRIVGVPLGDGAGDALTEGEVDGFVPPLLPSAGLPTAIDGPAPVWGGAVVTPCGGTVAQGGC
jgi:hypothetical protein